LNVNILGPCAEALEPRTSAQTPIVSKRAPRVTRGRATDTGTGNIEYLLSVDFDAQPPPRVSQTTRDDRHVAAGKFRPVGEERQTQ
jgi:hypothetical protein